MGAGTIRSVEEARAFADAGARFLVSPGLVPKIRPGRARARGTDIICVLSPTEIMAAVAAGADVVKMFPAGLGGPGYLAALRGPFPDVRFVPTGGIRVSDVPTWLEGGAVCVGLGSWLVGGSPPRTRADLDRITADARRAVELARGDP